MGKINTVREALEELILNSEGKGYRDDLLAKIEESVIDSLALRGYIINGVTVDDEDAGNYKRTWRITEKTKDYKRFFYEEPSEEDKQFGHYLYSLGVR
ncbi:MAG: hypothetical protein LBJ60_00455 [Tannerellaceae bacterium]|jgi:hypothetical protein|nr:hypothetical protein [Tannerellaceae bacterium]